MKIWSFALGVPVAHVPMVVAAYGPTRQRIRATRSLATDPETVWNRIGNFQDMSWHPAVFSTSGEGGNRVDATRVLTLDNPAGPTISQILLKYKPHKHSYSYCIDDVGTDVLPVTNYVAHLTVKEARDGGSLVEWRGAFYRGFPEGDPPEHLNDAAAIEAVTEMYTVGLDALKAEFERQ